MLRLRLGSLALAGGVLFTLSGCCSCCESGSMFSRLFNRSAGYGPTSRSGPECECHNNSFMGPTPQMISSQGAMPTMPSTSIPVTTIPAGQPPLFKNQYAAPVPFVP